MCGVTKTGMCLITLKIHLLYHIHSGVGHINQSPVVNHVDFSMLEHYFGEELGVKSTGMSSKCLDMAVTRLNPYLHSICVSY